jgi:TctA family transporter
MLDVYLQGMQVALQPQNLFLCFIGVLYGTLIGVLPGIGSVAGIAMLLPLTYHLPPTGALIMLAGIYYGSEYGGSTTSILLRTPGEGGSALACLDGYEMARQGQAKLALATAAIGSFIAGTLSTVLLMLLTVPLSRIAVIMGAPEYFALALMALLLTASMSDRSPIKGLAMLLLGLAIATIGFDTLSSVPRFSFGVFALEERIPFIVVATGLFAVSEVMENMTRGRNQERPIRIGGGPWITLADLRRIVPPALRGSGIGFVVGMMPGTGAIAATFLSYGVEQKLSRHPERFGKGAIEGLAGPESANNASSQAAMLPLITLGIPGSATAAVMLGAFMMYGLQPGPRMLTSDPSLVWGIITSMYVGNVMLLILNLPMIGMWVKFLTVPYHLLFPGIIAVCCIGVYSVSNNPFDVYTMAFFGVVGYVLVKLDCEPAPLILGFVIGKMLEEYLRRAMLLSRGDPLVFFQRPISAVLLVMAIAALVIVLIPSISKKRDEAFKE